MFRRLLNILGQSRSPTERTAQGIRSPSGSGSGAACPVEHAAAETQRSLHAADAAHEAPIAGSFDPRARLVRRAAEVVDAFRPFIQADGGDVDFVGVTEKNVVQVRLRGACRGCPSSFLTLQMGLERALLEQMPELRGVEDVG